MNTFNCPQPEQLRKAQLHDLINDDRSLKFGTPYYYNNGKYLQLHEVHEKTDCLTLLLNLLDNKIWILK